MKLNMDLAEANAAIGNFLGTFAFVKIDGIGEPAELPSPKVQQLMQELGWRAISRGRVDALAHSTLDSWFMVELNGVRLELPRYTLMTMRHCIKGSADGRVDLLVENAHWEKLFSELSEGTRFLDIGAATGAMSVPFDIAVKDNIRIVAFEPSRRARPYLESTIARNKMQNVTVLPVALSDSTGLFEFIELPEDDTGTVPFLPEASRLSTANETLNYPEQTSYPVEVTTLDSLGEQLRFSDARKLVVKIDVEGFEDKVLQGALETLKLYKPFLAIDIHVHPGSDKQTDEACKAILVPMGYWIERLAHVMLAYPTSPGN
jgi:FkbM family methyltransferase